MNKWMLPAVALFFFSCDGKSTVTERFKRVETEELYLKDEHGKNYKITIDENGTVNAVPAESNE